MQEPVVIDVCLSQDLCSCIKRSARMHSAPAPTLPFISTEGKGWHRGATEIFAIFYRYSRTQIYSSLEAPSAVVEGK
jgi:hypothetical protein